MTTGFTFLVLIHLTVVATQLFEQNKELIQELGLDRLGPAEPRSEILIIVPAYNEEQNIGQVLADLGAVQLPVDILVINDGSSDQTSKVARASGQARVPTAYPVTARARKHVMASQEAGAKYGLSQNNITSTAASA